MNTTGRIRPLLERINPAKALTYIVLLAGVWAIAYGIRKFGIVGGIALGVLPLGFCILVQTIRKPIYALFGLFVINYFIMGIGRYLPDIPMGVLLDILTFYNLGVLAIHSMFHKVDWKRAKTGLTLLATIWLVYGILQIVNPQTVSLAGWLSSFRSVSMYFFLMVVLTQIIIDDFRYVRYIIYIWSALTLLAVAKALIQKTFGFDATELHWLFVRGGSSTHIIRSGIRYFSFFTDAANFGAAMGLSMVVFLTTALHIEKKALKIYLILVAAAACYGMLISGTRSALAVPFTGYMFYIFMSKKPKIILLGLLFIAGTYIFLNHTYIGQGNAIIRRARSAFNPDDKSLVVRLENQAKLRELMADKPFGAGLGHGGGKAKEFAPDSPISQIPTDSWFVMIWVETGVVGIVLHLLILLTVVGYGAFLVMFRLKNHQVRGITASLNAGIVGIMAMSYANEVFGQIPTGTILYMSMAFIFLSPQFDRQLTCAETQKALKP